MRLKAAACRYRRGRRLIGSHRFEGPSVNGPSTSDFHAFRDCQRILQVHAEVTNGAVHFGVADEKLDRAQVPRLAIDLGNLGTPHLVCAISAWLQPDGCHPFPNQPDCPEGAAIARPSRGSTITIWFTTFTETRSRAAAPRGECPSCTNAHPTFEAPRDVACPSHRLYLPARRGPTDRAPWDPRV